MMTGNQQQVVERDENVNSTSIASPYVGSTPTSTISQMAEPTIRERQPKVETIEKTGSKGNPALTRALVGGLVGATLGTLAGALASQKTSAGFNHAVKGVGNAFKTVGSGLGQAGKGLGDAAKSVGEGVSYAVVGGTVDTAKSIADGAMQAGVATAGAVQTTVEKVNEVVQGTADSIKSTSESTTQSIINTAETGKELANNADMAITQELDQVEPNDTLITSEDNPFSNFERNQDQE